MLAAFSSARIWSISATAFSGVICPWTSSLTVNVLVDHHDRSKTAGAEAADGFNGEKQIVRSPLVGGEVELLIKRIENTVRFLHMAGGTIAKLDQILAFRLH